MGKRHTNRKARIEKKLSKQAMELLIQLLPNTCKREDFSLEYDTFDGPRGLVYHEDWCMNFGPDYWGECDATSAFFYLHDHLITRTTDWEGEMKAREEHGWERDDFDCSPYYSPWRLGDITRGQIIGHCRRLVKAGITWEPK
ncbi:hypothetical protein [Pantoea sp.]|uniref:hypothetical protein n=1 Tax=Pantoea sp. TaxID=69393 RepID=UPI0031D27563